MDKPKGGRAHKAPYETKQMRVPDALETQIQELVSRYRSWIAESPSRMSGIGVDNPPFLLDKPVDSFSQSEQELAELRAQLAEARNQIDQLKSPTTNFESARDRILAGLKLGKQSPAYKSAVKILNRFIAELV